MKTKANINEAIKLLGIVETAAYERTKLPYGVSVSKIADVKALLEELKEYQNQDFVPVVRCINCKYSEELPHPAQNATSKRCAKSLLFTRIVDNDFFCKSGELKE